MLAQAPRRLRTARRRRGPWAAAAFACALVVAALAIDPFTPSRSISSAQATGQAAAALDLKGAWHVTRVWRTGEAKGSGPPVFAKLASSIRQDIWHAPDGRMLVRSDIVGGKFGVCCAVTLYAGGERRTYIADRGILYLHRFAVAGDMRDDQRAYLPPSAADLYRTAYRDGVVRHAGTEMRAGRKVYRLAFDWLGSSYELIFDADRRVPISSEARTPGDGGRTWVTRVRYSVYQRVQPGARLERRLRLPVAAGSAKRDFSVPAIVVPRPVTGAAAAPLVPSITARLQGVMPPTAARGRSTYALVRPLRGEGFAAVVLIPDRAIPAKNCLAIAEIAHRGGEASIGPAGCGSSVLSTWSRDRTMALVAGTTRAHRVDLRFPDGTTIRASLRQGVYLAALPARRATRRFSIVSTSREGVVTVQRAQRVSTPPPNPTFL